MIIELSNKLEDVMLFLTLMTKEELYNNKYTRFSVKYSRFYSAIKVDGVVVGLLNISCRDANKGQYSYAIGILKNHRMQGIAKATVELIMTNPNVKYLLGVVDCRNKESMSLHKDWLQLHIDGKYYHYIKVRD